MPIIIDTLALYTYNFLYIHFRYIEIIVGFIKGMETTEETSNKFYLGMHRDGEKIYGQKAIIRGKLEELGIRAEVKGGCLKITFSVSRLQSDGINNLSVATPDSLDYCLKIVSQALQESGIYTIIDDFKLTRIDIAKDRILSSPLQTFLPLFQSAHFSSGVLRGIGKSYYFSNKQQATIFYDKSFLCKKKGLSMLPHQIGKIVCRCEYRMLNHRKIHSKTGIGTIKMLKESIDMLEAVYKENLRTLFNYSETVTGETVFKNIRTENEKRIEKARALRRIGRKNVFGLYIGAVGVEQVNETSGGLDSLIKEFISAGCITPQNGLKQKKSYLEILNLFSKIDATGTPGLYEEIIQKYLLE